MVLMITSVAAVAAAPTSSGSRLDVLRSDGGAPTPTLTLRVDGRDPIVIPVVASDEARSTGNAVTDPERPPLQRRLQGRRTLDDEGFEVRWDLEIDPDPEGKAGLRGSIVLASRTDATVVFDAVLSMPISPLIDGPTRVGGRAEVVLENDGDGGRLEVPPGEALLGVLYDGVEVHRLHRGPFVMGGPSAGVTTADAQFGAPIPGQSAGAIRDAVGVRLKASITSGEAVAVKVDLSVEGSPEDFIRRRSTAPVRIESAAAKRVITIGGGATLGGRRGAARPAGSITIAPARR